MIIDVDAQGSVKLLDCLDFKMFHIQAAKGLSIDALSSALAAGGTVEGNSFAWISPTWVRALSPLARSREWSDGLNQMFEKAEQSGWVHPETGFVRAHIVFG